MAFVGCFVKNAWGETVRMGHDCHKRMWTEPFERAGQVGLGQTNNSDTWTSTPFLSQSPSVAAQVKSSVAK